MKDYGKSTRLLLSDHLSTDELKLYLPSDAPSSVVNSAGIPMCISGSSAYCSESYQYKRSLIKATVEKWLEGKMQDNNLSKTDELEEMTFTDGIESINSYVRIPASEEDGLTKSVISNKHTVSYGSFTTIDGCKYSPLLSSKEQDDDLIATLTRGSDLSWYIILPFTGDGYCNGGSARFINHASQVMPIITVKES